MVDVERECFDEMGVGGGLRCESANEAIDGGGEITRGCDRTRDKRMRGELVEPLDELVFALLLDEREDVDRTSSTREHKRDEREQLVADLGGAEALVGSLGLGGVGEHLWRARGGQVELDGAHEVGDELPVELGLVLLALEPAHVRRRVVQAAESVTERPEALVVAGVVGALVLHEAVAVALAAGLCVVVAGRSGGGKVAPNELAETRVAIRSLEELHVVRIGVGGSGGGGRVGEEGPIAGELRHLGVGAADALHEAGPELGERGGELATAQTLRVVGQASSSCGGGGGSVE